jgi:hypothetical protein
LRPVDGTGCIAPPSDDVWAMITRCWAQECDMRPTMTDVCTSLKDQKRLTLLQGIVLKKSANQVQTKHHSLSDKPSYRGFEVKPTPLSPETRSEIQTSLGAMDPRAQENAEMNQHHNGHYNSFMFPPLPRSQNQSYIKHVHLVEDTAECENMDRVSPWSVGSHCMSHNCTHMDPGADCDCRWTCARSIYPLGCQGRLISEPPSRSTVWVRGERLPQVEYALALGMLFALM